MKLNLFLVTVLAIALKGIAHADECYTQPQSYTAPLGESGSFDYFDETGVQLIDGITGVNDWSANSAYEWVGWYVTDPTLIFTFTTNVTITSVRLGFARDESNEISLPSTVTIGGTQFNLNGSEVPDLSRGFLTFTGNWSGTNLTVNLSDQNPIRWIFLDEVQFKDPGQPCVVVEISTAVEICWPTETNKTYQLEWTTSLAPTNWTSFGTPMSGNGTNICVLESTRGVSRRFYRVRIVP